LVYNAGHHFPEQNKAFNLPRRSTMSPQTTLAVAMTSTTDERLSFAEIRAARDRHDCGPRERELPSENHD
jgi:hypothetical protein